MIVPSVIVETTYINTREHAVIIIMCGYKHYFLRQILYIVRTFSAVELHFVLTLSIVVTETVVKAQESLWRGQEQLKLKVEVTGLKPSPFQNILLQIKLLLSIVSYIWHYNTHFTFTHGKTKHPTPNSRVRCLCQNLVATTNAFTMAKWLLFRKVRRSLSAPIRYWRGFLKFTRSDARGVRASYEIVRTVTLLLQVSRSESDRRCGTERG